MIQRNILEEAQKRKLIREMYENEYFSFMNCDSLPRFNIDFTSQNPRISMMIIPNVKGGNYILKTHIASVDIMKNNARSLLFHEFTHVYDREILLEESTWEEKRSLLALYTEFHATIVQMKIAIGFKNEKETTKFSGLETICDGLDEMSFGEFLPREFDDNLSYFKKQLIESYSADQLDQLKDLLDKAMYLSAKLFFAKQYCTSAYDYLVPFHLIDIFGDSYNELISIFESGVVTKKTMFEALKCSLAMKKHYRTMLMGIK